MPTLYIVATPIGNLKDVTFRAIEILKSVDLILAEDTRVTGRLLQAYEITTKMSPFHQHSNHERQIVELLASGKNIALVSDAGTPGINDPGGKLIEAVVNSGIDARIEPIPGASALTALLSVAGIPLEHFSYRGFVPHKKGKETFLREVGESEYPVVFFESVHRIVKTLERLKNFMLEGKRLIIGRELTKMHETIYRGSIDEVIAKVSSDPVKGEYVIIVH